MATTSNPGARRKRTVQAKTAEASKNWAPAPTSCAKWQSQAGQGALADHGPEVMRPYLQRSGAGGGPALKRQRFQEYLNNTAQGVDTRSISPRRWPTWKSACPAQQRAQRVDFQPGRYLQLEPRAVVHQSLQELNRAQAQLRTESLRDDGGQSHYRALRAIVEMLQTHASNRRSKAAQALLDARYRLQFAVLVLDRASGQMLERRTGSQGGSGGEKEIIASYVLTASLSYALCPDGASRPVFGTIVLDEAFSKSSQAVAARIIQALREFACMPVRHAQQGSALAAQPHAQRRRVHRLAHRPRWRRCAGKKLIRRSAPSTPSAPTGIEA